MQTYLIIITQSSSQNDSNCLKGVYGNILLHAGGKKVKVCFYTAQYPVRWIAQSTLRALEDLFIPTPTRLLWEAF